MSTFNLSDRLNNSKKVVVRQEVIPERESEIVDVSVETIDSDVTAFCKRASRFISSKEELRNILDFIRFIGEYKLAKQCNIASKDLDGYWLLIEQYASLSDEQVREDVESYVSYRDENTVNAIRNVLWNEGSGNLTIGMDLSQLDHENPIIRNALDNKSKLVADVVSRKYNDLVPVIEQVMRCIPAEDTRHCVTIDAKREFVFEMVDQFIKGEEFNYRFDLKKMGSVTQAGIMLPHTLGPRDWLATAVSSFMHVEFGAKTMIMFVEKGMSDIRAYDHTRDAFLLYSEDERSPLHYTVTPSIHCTSYEKNEEGLEIWAWRNAQKSITAQVNSICLQQSDVSPANREKVRREVAYDTARGFVESSKLDLDWEELYPYMAILPETWREKTGAEAAIRFFKRGYSTPQEVGENKQYIHVVTLNNARTMTSSGYIMIQLSDMNSVIALPSDLWALSNFVQSGGSGAYISTYGVQKVNSMDDPYLAFFTFFSLACTKQMLDKWQKGETFDFPQYAEDFIAILKRKNSYATLLKTNSRNLNDKINVVTVLMRPFPGPVNGLVLAPESTKHGKSSLASYTKNAGYDSQYGVFTKNLKYDFNDADDYSYLGFLGYKSGTGDIESGDKGDDSDSQLDSQGNSALSRDEEALESNF